MRITIVNGFFLPVPPVSGGSTEKSWFNLAQRFAARGHNVTMISRRWPGFPHSETINGVSHLRLHGADHRDQRWLNLLLDFIWSWRVYFALPEADIVVVNAVALPVWLGALKPNAGRVVVMTGRMPKGQYRHYRTIARVLAASSFVRDWVIAENPSLAPVTKVYGYPINWRQMSESRQPLPDGNSPVTIGFVGRIHEEKGLLLLADALNQVSQTPGLPAWRLLLCGPADVARGGSGPDFRARLVQRLSSAMPADRFTLIDPQFDEKVLAEIYQRIAIFIYPSLAVQGETFGVAVAEAMAAGAVPVVSQLACFADFVRSGETGLDFAHDAPDAANRLTAVLIRLLRDTSLRHTLAQAARTEVQRYDYHRYADSLLADFTTLNAHPSSPLA